MSDSEEENFTPLEVSEESFKTQQGLLPEKSRKKYEKCYEDFMQWRESNKITSFSENDLLVYFMKLEKTYKSSSLWSIYSMLRATLEINHQIKLEQYHKLKALLKRKSEGFSAKKSKVFAPEEINKFINEAPDILYLLTKVALIFGVMGACRRQELYSLKAEDVEDLNTMIFVRIRNLKTKQDRSFTITGRSYTICKQYMALRPNPCTNAAFFLKFTSGKCTSQNVGINSLGNLGKTIASYLNLPNPELYTGHCFRRTSATILVNAGGDITCLKRRGGRKSTQRKLDVSNQTVNAVQDKTDDEINMSSSSDSAGEESHDTLRCDSCCGDIEGIRQVCVECEYTHCMSCEARGAHAHHYMLRVPGPRPEGVVRRIVKMIQMELADIISDAQPTVDPYLAPEITKIDIKMEPEPDPLTEECSSVEQLRPSMLEQAMLEIDIKQELDYDDEVVDPPDESATFQAALSASSDWTTTLPSTYLVPISGEISPNKRRSSSAPQASAAKKKFVNVDASSSNVTVKIEPLTAEELLQTHQEASGPGETGVTSNTTIRTKLGETGRERKGTAVKKKVKE